MNDQYLEYVVFLEKTLARFYRETVKSNIYHSISSVLEFMETHSEEHAEMIDENMREHPRPALDPGEVLNYQNNLTKKVSRAIESGADIKTVLTLLSETEESLGDFYKSIASKMKDLADHYKNVAAIIDRLGDDEYSHRDILARDIKRLYPG